MQNKRLMQEFVLNLLKDNLSKDLYYHNPGHTLYVIETAMEIGRNEGCTAKELDLVRAAALWHDTGYTVSIVNHEEESCSLAKQYLPEFGYSPEDINTISGMIMATRIPQSPKNKLEEIMADADLEYLGTPGFDNTADDLFRELSAINPELTAEKWNHVQISFLRKHQYFTRFCKEHKEPVKMSYLYQLEHGLK